MDTWNHLPPILQSLVIGNLIQWTAIALLRLARGKWEPLGPLLDRVGPKSVRDPNARRASAGCGVAIAWFALSWVIGHEARRATAWIVHHVVHH